MYCQGQTAHGVCLLQAVLLSAEGGRVMLKFKKIALGFVPVLFLGAGFAEWCCWPSSPTYTAPAVPADYITAVMSRCERVDGTHLNPPPQGQACVVLGVNNSGKPIESVRFKFSTEAELTFANHFVTSGFKKGQFHSTKLLMPGDRVEYLALPRAGIIESVAIGWGEPPPTHAVRMPLTEHKKSRHLLRTGR